MTCTSFRVCGACARKAAGRHAASLREEWQIIGLRHASRQVAGMAVLGGARGRGLSRIGLAQRCDPLQRSGDLRRTGLGWLRRRLADRVRCGDVAGAARAHGGSTSTPAAGAAHSLRRASRPGRKSGRGASRWACTGCAGITRGRPRPFQEGRDSSYMIGRGPRQEGSCGYREARCPPAAFPQREGESLGGQCVYPGGGNDAAEPE